MEKELAPGDRAPHFKLATDEHGEISTGSLKGKPFVLYFYPKDDTSGCTKEAMGFSDAKRKFDATGVTVVGVSKDDVISHQKFRTKYKLKITLASDPDTETAKSYGVWVEKSMYGRRYMGMERATFLVDGKGVIREVWRKVKVPGHVEAVLAAARAVNDTDSSHPQKLTPQSFFWAKSLIKRPEQGEVSAIGVSAKSASKGRSSMAETLIERIWAWLHATFPERQIYIRSEGRVQFFTFGPTLQATLSGLALIFLGWIAFASVNVIFKDRIIASKNQRYQQMQWAYENRVADLQQSYDELNGALVTAEDRFKAVADELETKQETVTRLLGRKEAVDALVAGTSSAPNAAVKASGDAEPILRANGGNTASDSIGADLPSGNSQLSIMPRNPEPQRTDRPTKASFLDEAVTRLAASLFAASRLSPAQPLPQQPALKVLALQTARIVRMNGSETALLQNVDRGISTRIGDLQSILRRVGLNSNDLEQQAFEGMGGPFIPIEDVHIEGISDSAFASAYLDASAHEKELNTLFAALNHVPLTTPLRGAQFEITSGFGPRIDPFTGRVGFHPGVDFAGPWGSFVIATAPGTVVWAGPRGGYGNLVEIDHGYGFHTRYGHLAAILVHVGAKVAKGAPIGKLGSTGRSTGPHVHYEVWLADVVRDPSRYIEAGHYVLQ